MSTATNTLRNGLDTWVNQTLPSTNYGDDKRMGVNNTAANLGYTFIYFPRPFRPKSTIMSATLRVYTKTAWGTSVQLSVERLFGLWPLSKTNYNNMPGITGAAVSVTATPNADGFEYAFDVASLLQLVSDGGAWYGFRIRSNNSALRYLYSTNALDYRPTLQVTWVVPPEAPTSLRPSGNRAVDTTKPVFRFDYNDDPGSTALQSIQVQQNATDVWTDPTFDTGAYSATEPELDTNTFSYARTPSVTRTNLSINITAATGTFSQADVGAAISGTGIPTGATIAVVTSSTAAQMSANASSSGTATATITRTYAALAAAANPYWRVRVQDAAGMWSAWSDSARFQRDTKGTLTITNPAAASPVVKEWTPPLAWTFTGETQKAWQLIIAKAADPTAIKYDTTRTKGTELSHTLPKHIIRDGASYRMTLRVWDTVDREHTPKDPPYVEATRDFTFAEDATPGPVTGLTATEVSPYPWVDIGFTRTTAPDYFVFKVDGKVVDTKILAADVLVSGTTYKIRYKDARPLRMQTYVVQAVVNGLTSANNPSITKQVTPDAIWLYDNEHDVGVNIIARSVPPWPMGEMGTTYYPVGATQGVRVTQALRGWEGSVEGILAPGGGKTASEWEDQLLKIKERPGQVCTLTVGDDSFRCVPYNISASPGTGKPNITKQVSFEFFQVGNLDWEPRI